MLPSLLYYDEVMELDRRSIFSQPDQTFLAFARKISGLLTLMLVLCACNVIQDNSQLPPILYLGWDENERNQVYRQNHGEEPAQITRVEDGVLDFAVSPDGRTLVYTTLVDDGNSEIWKIDATGHDSRLILTCNQAECSQPVWAPDNRRLVYEKRNIGDDGIPGSPYLWWLAPETGETRTVLENYEARGTALRFSPDGQWLSYVSPEKEGAVIYNLQDGRSHFVANEIGVPVAWSPNSSQIIVPNLDLVIIHGDEGDDHLNHTHNYETATHLFDFDVASGESVSISGDLKVEDSVPAWSPNGDWIAFGRRFPGTSAGRQLWLMRPDGSEAYALTSDFDFTYGLPLWSPDGRYLLFQRFPIDKPDGEPGIWLFDIENGQESELVAVGMQPAWLVEATRN